MNVDTRHNNQHIHMRHIRNNILTRSQILPEHCLQFMWHYAFIRLCFICFVPLFCVCVCVVVITVEFQFIETMKTPAYNAIRLYDFFFFDRNIFLLDWGAFVLFCSINFNPNSTPFLLRKVCFFLHIRYVWQSKLFIVSAHRKRFHVYHVSVII